MQTGFSIYPGLDTDIEEDLKVLDIAGALGIDTVFTSLHIPESDPDVFTQNLRRLLAQTKKNEMQVIADVSPRALSLLNITSLNLEALKELGITTLRLDDGYSSEETAHLSRNSCGMRICLNASTITEDQLQKLKKLGTNFAQVSTLHNFYPRENTGLSEETLVEKTRLLHSYGISVGAFVPSYVHPRLPLRAGLPTLEAHRQFSVSLAARHLVALDIDDIFIGDPLPVTKELQALASLRSNCVTIRARLYVDNELIRELLSHSFTSRTDAARDAFRAIESRLLLQGSIVEPANITERLPGDITLDNKGYERYMGELQIIKNPLPADNRSNVIGHLLPEEAFLTAYITPGRKFSLQII